MNYKEATDWLFQQFPAYQNLGVSAYKPDLSNILRLCEILEIPYQDLKCIHVAGTNGKGSTCSYLASILTESGEKVGLFTSPHILDFSERIRINGKAIEQDKVILFCEKIKSLNLDFSPSFFEITWALALDYFLIQKCTISVIETGLGGRLDSTNIITPILSIITNIGLDHVSILGNTLEKIAYEKAGIMKKDVPILIGQKQTETSLVYSEIADKKNAELFYVQDFYTDFKEADNYLEKNKKTVRAAIQLLNQKKLFSISEKQISSGFENVNKNTGFIGRFTTFSNNPQVILDVAHNEDGIKELLFLLNKLEFNTAHIIFGTSSDKDFSSMLNLFPKDLSIYFTEFSNPRSMKIDSIPTEFRDNRSNFYFFTSILEIFPKLQVSVNEQDVIVVTGSFFLISDFLNFFSENRL